MKEDFLIEKVQKKWDYTKKLDKVDQYLCTWEFCLQG